MQTKTRTIVGSLAAGMTAAVAAFMLVVTTSDQPGARAETPSSTGTVRDDSGQPDFPRNAAGQTYGSAADARTPDEEPDLISVTATNGKVSYVRRDLLTGFQSKNPEEALAWMREHGDDVEVFTVTEADGVTEVGKFTSGGK